MIVLVVLPLLFTDSLTLKFDVVELAPPMPVKQPMEVTYWKPPAPPKVEPKPFVAPPPEKPLVRTPERSKPEELPKVEEVKPLEIEQPAPVVRKIEPVPSFSARVETPAAPAKKAEVRTDVFSTGSSAQPTTKLSAKEVQTGGFGDPNGMRGPGRPDKAANIASLGSFDLPVGPGVGNGTGGAKGARGTVASAGFGNGVATPGPGSSGGSSGTGKSVKQGGFGTAQGGSAAAAPRKREAAPAQTPIEITFKPRPDYTDEARKRKLEGEVLVRAVFTAGGEVRVMEVIRGLGHGLDENAIRAAQQIRFKPALREGQPVDSIATVHIVFQLAY